MAAEHAARRFDPDARIRLRRTSEGGVAFELANEAGPGDEVFDAGEFSLVIERGLEGVVDAGDHNVLLLQPETSDS